MILKEILKLVSETTEISVSDILSKTKREDVVLARELFVNIAFDYGFSTLQISKTLHKSRECIRKTHLKSIDNHTNVYTIYRKQITNLLATKI